MKINLFYITILFFLCVLSTPLKASKRCVTIIGNSDLHGNVNPLAISVKDGAKEKKLRKGGLLAQIAYIDILKKRYGNDILLLDAGDLYHGTFLSNDSRGAVIIEAYNLLGYSGVAVGNHEFDFGRLNKMDTDTLGVFKERVHQSNFPFLSVNFYLEKKQKPLNIPNIHPSILVESNGIKVGIIGASTIETKNVTILEHVAHLDFPNPAPYIIKKSNELRDAGAEVIILLAHMGGYCTELENPYNISSCQDKSEFFQLLKSLPKNHIDVAIGGHTHGFIRHFVNGIATSQAGSKGRFLGHVDVCLKKSGQKNIVIHKPIAICVDMWSDGGCDKRSKKNMKKHKIVPATFLGERIDITKNKELNNIFKPFIDKVKKRSNQSIQVFLQAPLERGHKKGKHSLGNLVADSMRISTQSDFSIQNRGGVRTDLPKGKIVYKQIFKVLPFGNRVGVVTLKGKDLYRVIEHMNAYYKGMQPYMSGLRYEVKGTSFVLKKDDGKPIDLETFYTLATNSFLLTGGDGLNRIFNTLGPNSIKILPISLLDSFLHFLQKNYPEK